MKEASKGLSRLVQLVQIESVRLKSGRAETKILSPDDAGGAAIEIRARAQVSSPLSADGRFAILAEVDVKVPRPTTKSQPLVWVHGEFELSYRLPEDLKPTKEDLQQFATVNSVFNAWPYFREYVQDQVVRMGLPPIILPLHRIAPAPAPRSRRKAESH